MGPEVSHSFIKCRFSEMCKLHLWQMPLKNKKQTCKHADGSAQHRTRGVYLYSYLACTGRQIKTFTEAFFFSLFIPSFGLDLLGLFTGNHTVDNITWHLHAWAWKNSSRISVICILPATPIQALFHVRGSSGCIFSVTSSGNGIRSGFYAFNVILCQEC